MNETYEEKKARREAEKAAEGRGGGKSFKKIIVWVVILAALGAGGYGLYALVKSRIPEGPDFSTAYPVISREHIAEGSRGGGYNSNPPTSGPHYGSPAPVGFYRKELPDERVIHNLEHGDVWVAYHPRVESVARPQLEQFADFAKVIITPRSANEADIAVVSWGRVDAFDLEGGVVPAERIAEFIYRYRDKSPERVTQRSARESELE